MDSASAHGWPGDSGYRSACDMDSLSGPRWAQFNGGTWTTTSFISSCPSPQRSASSLRAAARGQEGQEGAASQVVKAPRQKAGSLWRETPFDFRTEPRPQSRIHPRMKGWSPVESGPGARSSAG